MTSESAVSSKYECPECGHPHMRDITFDRVQCEYCTRIWWREEALVEKPKKSSKPTRRISDRHENKTAKAVGGSRTLNSGATPVDKGDVKAAGLRIECKSTRAKGYRLTWDDLTKIASQAIGDEIPVFAIEFRGEGFADEYWVLPKAWALELLRNRNDLDDS